MPMLDPLATFLMRVQEAGNDVDPVVALFRRTEDITPAQQDMADQLAQRGRDRGLIADTSPEGADPARVGVTATGEQYLAEFDL